MDFEKLYSILPDFIKYNNFILNSFIKISKKLNKLNNKSNYMKSQHQLFELIFINSDFKLNGILRDIQLLYLEFLRFIDNICSKYDIEYWITGGTLLGAVRHKGFIPWDDDIDINMMRKDYEKFIKVFPHEISKYDYFKQECGLSLLRNNHENYFKEFNSVYDFEGNANLLDSHKFIFLQIAWLKPYIKIDIFPRDYVSDDKINYFKKNYLSTKYKFNQDIKNGKHDFETEFKIKCDELGITQNKTKYINDGLDTLQLYNVCIHESDKVFPLQDICFDKYTFKCPNDVNHYLTQLFGLNYMKLPKTIENHNIIPFIESQFKSKEEMTEKFKKSIKYLKEINDNFK